MIKPIPAAPVSLEAGGEGPPAWDVDRQLALAPPNGLTLCPLPRLQSPTTIAGSQGKSLPPFAGKPQNARIHGQ